jgi:hypothetical protein
MFTTTPAGRVALVALLWLCACGRAAPPPAPAPALSDPGGFDQVVAAVAQARIAWCPSPEGGAFIPVPARPAQTAAAAPYFRYVEGRIYQFGPCSAPADRRNELRVFRYPDADVRDAAIRAMAGRNSRPTAAFAFDDTFEAQIWSPDPSLEGPVGQAAAAVHAALGRSGHARHLDVEP